MDARTIIEITNTDQNKFIQLQFEPENMPNLSFKFGQLYHSADYPYQAAINTLRGVQAPKPEESRAIQILPQVTRRKARKTSEHSDSDSGTTNIFVTRLPKKHRAEKEVSSTYTEELATRNKDKTSWSRMEQSIPMTMEEAFRPVAKKELPPVRERHRRALPSKEKNWMEDARYLTLTSILGERFSPKKKFRSHIPAPNIA